MTETDLAARADNERVARWRKESLAILERRDLERRTVELLEHMCRSYQCKHPADLTCDVCLARALLAEWQEAQRER